VTGMRNRMSVSFDPAAWEDYLYWQQHNPVIFQRINTLIGEIQQNPHTLWRKSALLGDDFTRVRSLRINLEHRLIYGIQNNTLLVLQCRYHL